MDPADNLPPTSLGLWGDGDEIAAISEVEQHFGVRLDYSDAINWVTAGDVFSALKRALPLDQADAASTWSDFARAIAIETGVDPERIEPQTRLLGHRHVSWRTSVLIALIAGLVLALILRF
jgi:hypothetical protein